MMHKVFRNWRLAVLIFSLALWPTLSFGSDKTENERNLVAGPLTFSDELGGHAIVSVSGTGTKLDPIIIVQKTESLEPSTMTIRDISRLIERHSALNAWTSLHIRFVIHNISAASWIGYRFELQEELGTPSIYGDGLSFNQITRNDRDVSSDRFSRHEVEFEPGDRLLFYDGWVNQRETVVFNLFVLDLSPADIFYLVQVPQLPAS